MFSLAGFRLGLPLVASRSAGLVPVEGTSAVEIFKATLAERNGVAFAIPFFWAGKMYLRQFYPNFSSEPSYAEMTDASPSRAKKN